MSVTNKLKHQRTARDKFFGKVMERNYVVITFIQKSIPLKKPRVAIFADMIKILTIFIKNICKDSKKGCKN